MSASPTPLTRTGWPKAIAVGIAAALAVGIVVLAFLWPSKTSTAQHLPVSISGPEASVDAFTKQLNTASPDTFEFVAAEDRDDAIAQIEARETYGAFVLGSAPTELPEVLTAPAGSAVATQMLTGMATQLSAQLTQAAAAAGSTAPITITVTPVAPLSDSDPSGNGLAAAAFPLAMGGMIGGALISILVRGPIRRLAALAGFSIAVGLVLTGILQSWFGFIQGNFWLNVLAFGVSILATAAFIVGCTSLIGPAGIGIGAVLTLFIGNPLSAAAVPWQFIPQPWGIIGQFFVPGASSSLMRSISYFPNADTSMQWLILTGWIVLGLALTLIGAARTAKQKSVVATESAPAGASVTA